MFILKGKNIKSMKLHRTRYCMFFLYFLSLAVALFGALSPQGVLISHQSSSPATLRTVHWFSYSSVTQIGTHSNFVIFVLPYFCQHFNPSYFGLPLNTPHLCQNRQDTNHCPWYDFHTVISRIPGTRMLPEYLVMQASYRGSGLPDQAVLL